MSRSEKKGFRRFLPLIVLAAALLLAAAFVLLLPVIKKAFPSESALKYQYNPTYKAIDERDPDTLQSITVSHLDGDSYTLSYQNGALTLLTDDAEPEAVSSLLAGNITEYATNIFVEDTVADDVNDVLENLPDMGLKPPQITVTAIYDDDSEVTISLGYRLPETAFYYYRWSGDNGVYLCSSGIYETFEYTADMLLSITQPPVIPSLIERISILHGDGEPIVCTFESDGEDTLTGTLQSPYTYPMDTEAAETLRSAVENFRLGSRLAPVTDGNRALYGLDSPQAVVKVAQREGLYSQTTDKGVLQSVPLAAATITLAIGDADGEFFRYCEYEGTCYRVSNFLVAAFLNADADAYRSQNPADMGAVTMQSIVAQMGSGTLDIRASYTENVLPNNELETDKYGNVVYTVEVTSGGEPIPADAFDALVERLGQMSVSGSLDTVTEPDGTPRWQLTLTTVQGKTRTLTAYPMDAFNDVLAVDGVALSYISNEALDIALGEFSALAQPTETP